MLERATPVFGTLATVRVEGLESARAAAAVSRAFAALRLIHRRMSFHEPASDLSRLNRQAAETGVRVTPHTWTVLKAALAVARASHGTFDPVAAAALAVAAGTLPRPAGAPEPEAAASWRDVILQEENRTVRFRRPLWLDLGGVAKGYAVDLAVTVLQRHGARQGCVNAGGDLRAFGLAPEPVALDTGLRAGTSQRAILVSDQSLASSGSLARNRAGQGELALHFDGRTRKASPRRFVAVLADRCIHADALTKVVAAEGAHARDLLAAFGARAAICSANHRWSVVGEAL